MIGVSGGEMILIGIGAPAAQPVNVSRRAIVAGALASLLPDGVLRAFAAADPAQIVLVGGWVLSADDFAPGAGVVESLDVIR